MLYLNTDISSLIAMYGVWYKSLGLTVNLTKFSDLKGIHMGAKLPTSQL